jgi:hypothetical protein
VVALIALRQHSLINYLSWLLIGTHHGLGWHLRSSPGRCSSPSGAGAVGEAPAGEPA